ncbi:MAG TPA: pilus assembly protein TadG-related protein [Candidatus Limnocylindria bacterium]|nr:pilus assembly protein TadG-related protein [Candidatus Limnocylindria bacterium]
MTLRRFFGRDAQDGQALILVALFMTALLFAVGLAIDTGQLFVAKRTMQEAADAAAFAGGVVFYQGGSTAQAISAATADATLNGYTSNVNNTTVTVNSPPTSGAFSGSALYVEVIIVQQVRTSLVPAEAAFNPVRARGVGGAAPGVSPFAIVALKTTGPCITVSGSGGITVPNGPNLGGQIQANCTGNSIQFGGSGAVTDTLGVKTVGTVSNPSLVLPNAGLTQNTAKIPDPFAGFPKPPVSNVVSNSQYTVPASACNSATPLTPGTYVGGIVNNQNCTVYLGSGVFILKGGGFNQAASSGNVTTVAGGAMVFNTHSNYPGAKGAGTCGDISAQTGGGFNITGMSTGLYAGMAYYQDISCTNTVSVQSNGSFLFHGTVYAPGATFDIQSQANMVIDAQLVVSQLTFSSSGTLTVNYHLDQAAKTGLPTLVE